MFIRYLVSITQVLKDTYLGYIIGVKTENYLVLISLKTLLRVKNASQYQSTIKTQLIGDSLIVTHDFFLFRTLLGLLKQFCTA
jgi:hypothetical protein